MKKSTIGSYLGGVWGQTDMDALGPGDFAQVEMLRPE
jgi:hypothetical protein